MQHPTFNSLIQPALTYGSDAVIALADDIEPDTDQLLYELKHNMDGIRIAAGLSDFLSDQEVESYILRSATYESVVMDTIEHDVLQPLYTELQDASSQDEVLGIFKEYFLRTARLAFEEKTPLSALNALNAFARGFSESMVDTMFEAGMDSTPFAASLKRMIDWSVSMTNGIDYKSTLIHGITEGIPSMKLLKSCETSGRVANGSVVNVYSSLSNTTGIPPEQFSASGFAIFELLVYIQSRNSLINANPKISSDEFDRKFSEQDYTPNETLLMQQAQNQTITAMRDMFSKEPALFDDMSPAQTRFLDALKQDVLGKETPTKGRLC